MDREAKLKRMDEHRQRVADRTEAEDKAIFKRVKQLVTQVSKTAEAEDVLTVDMKMRTPYRLFQITVEGSAVEIKEQSLLHTGGALVTTFRGELEDL